MQIINTSFFSQSTDKTDAELNKILASIGNGNGLNSYDEFNNTFNILPEKNIENDVFLAYGIDKLDSTYSRNKGYTKWSKEMVGHWTATGYFNNKDKGIWTFSLFDLLTKKKQNYIYGSLYLSDSSENKVKSIIFGVKGNCIYVSNFDWSGGGFSRDLSEINFGIDRYVYAIGNSYSYSYNKEQLIKRAEAMQFKKNESVKAEEPVASK